MLSAPRREGRSARAGQGDVRRAVYQRRSGDRRCRSRTGVQGAADRSIPETGEVLERDLVGALDLLERDPKGLVVVDLKTAVTFMLSAEELRWLVRRLEAEPPVLGYAP